jgi:hypothetical protein
VDVKPQKTARKKIIRLPKEIGYIADKNNGKENKNGVAGPTIR